MNKNGITADALDVVVDIPIGKNSMRLIELFDDETQSIVPFESFSHVGKLFFQEPAIHWSPVAGAFSGSGG